MTSVFSLCWKEYREQRLFWLVVLVLGYGLVLGVGGMLAPGGFYSIRNDATLRTSFLGLLLVLAAAYATACAGLLFAGERENGTELFLERQGVRRSELWMIKIAVGLFLSLSLGMALAALGAQLRLSQDERQIGEWWIFMLLLSLDCYCWGLVGSVLASSVLSATGVTALLLVMSWSVLVGLGPLLKEGTIALRGLLALGAMGLSWWLYVAPDRARLRRRLPATEADRPGSFTTLYWLSWQQGKGVMIYFIAVALCAGIALGLQGWLMLWPITTFLFGVICGVLVFGHEQAQGTARFLGEQRVPPGRLWLAKVLFWVGTLLESSAVLLVIGMAGLIWQRSISSHLLEYPDFGEFLIKGFGILVRDPVVLLLLWPLQGFAIGLAFTLLLRKPVVAAVLALLVGSGWLAAWLPSLLLGGLPSWAPFLPPLLLMLGSWLVLRPWLGGWLLTPQPLLLMGGLLLVGIGWTVLLLWHRSEEIPDVGEPFPIAAFRTQLDNLQKTGTGEKLRGVLEHLREQEKAVTARLGPPTRPIFSAQGEDAVGPAGEQKWSYFYLIWDVPEKGWIRETQELGRWLDVLFSESWAKELAEVTAGPAGLLQDPRVTRNDYAPWQEEARRVATLLAARALQLGARGEAEPALDHLLTCLDLSRHIRQPISVISYLVGCKVEYQGLQGLAKWRRHPAVTPAQLRRALDHLHRYEKLRPLLLDSFKAEWFLFEHRRWEIWPDREYPRNVKLALNAPWEKERDRRLINLLWRQLIQQVAAGESPIRPAWTTATNGIAGEYGFSEENGPQGLTLARLGHIIRLANASSGWPLILPSCQRILESESRNLYLLRAEQVYLALRLFEQEEGRPAAKLGDLVPRYLGEIPINPQTGQRFTGPPEPLADLNPKRQE